MRFSNILIGLVLALIVIQVIGAPSVSIQSVKANSTISVPENYSTISAAIANAISTDTIIVRQGVYKENPVIDKRLTLIADGDVTVIGEGGMERGARAVFTINAEAVSLVGFTIKSQSYTNSNYCATGININGDGAGIFRNTISGTYYGIFCSVQSFATINGNNITATKKEGIRICGGCSNTIAGNRIIGNAQSGIALGGYLDTVRDNIVNGNTRGLGLGAAYSVVFNNSFTNNSESGLYIGGSNNTVASNAIINNKWGVYFTSFFAAPNNNTFYSNNFIDNDQQAGTDSIYNTQIWDNSTTAGGNYWSDYNGTDLDGDGIGDTPYTAYINNVDKYPLMTLCPSTPIIPCPTLPIPPTAVNGLAGLWHFDKVAPNGVAPDAVGNNPVILEPSNGNKYTPLLVEGKTGNALSFNGTDYAYIIASPNLDVKEEIAVDAWIYVREFKNIAYNNIVVECERTPDKYPNRILGFAFNGENPQNSSSPLLGALRGFMLSKDGTFNEIMTTNAAVSLHQWTHVVFVRSSTDGMHIYMNDVEENVRVTSGSQNPIGEVARGTEFYIGHDSISTIDEVSISTTATKPIAASPTPVMIPVVTAAPATAVSATAFWAGWWFLTAIGATVVLVCIIYLVRRNSGKHLSA